MGDILCCKHFSGLVSHLVSTEFTAPYLWFGLAALSSLLSEPEISVQCIVWCGVWTAIYYV